MAFRLRRALLTVGSNAAVASPVSAALRPAAVPAPTPATVTALTVASLSNLDEIYAANRVNIGAARDTALDYGATKRAALLSDMADPSRQFLTFDGRDGGRTAEVYGDLANATRIAVLVPGSDTSLDDYQPFQAPAEAVTAELGGAAEFAWLGYKTPSTTALNVLTADRAIQAAPDLTLFVSQLATVVPDARISLLCHSYGSVVCAQATADDDAPADKIVLFGSPGTGATEVADPHAKAIVWAGRGDTDWIANVPNIRIPIPGSTEGFGTDPVSPDFGAKVLDAGSGGHNDYFTPGSEALTNIARIVADETPTQPQGDQ